MAGEIIEYEPSQKIKDLQYQAKIIMEANIYKDIGLNPSKAFLKIKLAEDLGLSLTAGLMGIRVNDNGVFAFSTEMMKALVQNNGKWKWVVIENTEKVARLDWYELDIDKKTWVGIGSSSWTIEEAKLADLLRKDNWSKYPKDMLFARAVSRGIRTFCPIVTMGHPAYTEEETEWDDGATDSEGNLKEVFNRSFVKPEKEQLESKVELAEELVHSNEYIKQLMGESGIDMFTIKKTYNVKSIEELNNKKREILVNALLKGKKG
jgi:hypothetical protein